MILLPTILYTIVAITGLMGCLMSLVLYFLKKTYPKPINGLGDWALFPLLAFFASFLYGMQGKWHHLISMALPNLLLVLTAVTQLRGTYRHFEKPVNTKLIAVIVFIALLLILWSSGKSEYYLHRLLSMTGFLAIMFAAQLKVLWARRRESFATKLMVITLAFLCITMAIRFISALIEPPPVGVFVFSPSKANSISKSFESRSLGGRAFCAGKRRSPQGGGHAAEGSAAQAPMREPAGSVTARQGEATTTWVIWKWNYQVRTRPVSMWTNWSRG
jgi:hypothetical protein